MRATAKLAGLATVALLLMPPARAQVPAAPDELPPLELGHIPQYLSEAEAHQACPHDIVVWADRDSGYFYPRWHPKFGKTRAGTFTCLREAMAADYWNINPFASNPEHGREFPIDPSLLEFGS